MPVPGVRASASTRLASAPGSTRASGFRNTSTSPRATSAPRFAPAAKPRLAPVSTSRTCGWRAQAAPALPSLEALSTSTISGAGTPPAARRARPASRAWPAFQLTMMTETVTRAGGRRPAPARSPSSRRAGARRGRSALTELGGEHLAERVEGALAEQAAEARLGSAQVQAVADAREERRPRDDRLLGIDLPGVQVDDRRPALGVDALDRPARHPERQEAEGRAARHRAVVAGEPHRAHRELPQAGFEPGREPARAIRAVPPAREHGLEARVVADAVRAQDVESPECPGGEREARSAIAEERAGPAERAPDGGERARQVVGELLRALPLEELVCVAVAPHLVPRRGHLAHHL